MFPKSLSTSWFSNKLIRAISHVSRSFPCLRVIMLIAFLPILLISGCGYHFSSGGEYINKDIRNVFIDNFPNRTSEPYIENNFRNAFIDEFTTGGRFRVVNAREKADAVFRGSIESLTTAPLSYQKSNLAAEERITVTMELAFEEQGTKKIIWTNKNFSGYQDYATPNLNTKEANRKNALIKLSNDTAERAYRLMMSGF